MGASLNHPATVYKLYGDDGVLLYVGCSINAPARLMNHKSRRGWWTTIARAEFEHYENQALGRQREYELIVGERPAYNVQVPKPVVA